MLKKRSHNRYSCPCSCTKTTCTSVLSPSSGAKCYNVKVYLPGAYTSVYCEGGYPGTQVNITFVVPTCHINLRNTFKLFYKPYQKNNRSTSLCPPSTPVHIYVPNCPLSARQVPHTMTSASGRGIVLTTGTQDHVIRTQALVLCIACTLPLPLLTHRPL